jgi:hypothetical protein
VYQAGVENVVQAVGSLGLARSVSAGSGGVRAAGEAGVMTYSKESFTDELVNWILEKVEKKQYGTFGVEITMHEGMPVAMTKNERNNFTLISGGIETK